MRGRRPEASDVEQTGTGQPGDATRAGATKGRTKTPLYPRLLRLRHVSPNAWQRAVLGEGALGVAGLLVLADLATAWTLVALPVAVAVVVKAHDGLAGLLARPPRECPPREPASEMERPSEMEPGSEVGAGSAVEPAPSRTGSGV